MVSVRYPKRAPAITNIPLAKKSIGVEIASSRSAVNAEATQGVHDSRGPQRRSLSHHILFAIIRRFKALNWPRNHQRVVGGGGGGGGGGGVRISLGLDFIFPA